MPTSTRCPECHAPVTRTDAGPGDPVSCPGCFAEFTAPAAPKRLVAEVADEDVPFAVLKDEPKPKPPTARVRAAAAGPPTKPKGEKKKKAAAESAGRAKKVIGAVAGAVAFAVAYFGVQQLFFGGKPADNPPGGGAAAVAPAGAGAPPPSGFVVYDTPGNVTATGPAAAKDGPPPEPRQSSGGTGRPRPPTGRNACPGSPSCDASSPRPAARRTTPWSPSRSRPCPSTAA